MSAAFADFNPLPPLDEVERRFERPGWLYPLGVALACTLGWIVLTEVVRLVALSGFYGVPFALGAVVLAAWVGGIWSGLTCAAISAALLYAVVPSVRENAVEIESVWHLVVFSLVAVLISRFEANVREQRRRALVEREMRNEFLSIVSHELRTPVTVIGGSANLLERRWDALSVQERTELLEGIQLESTRLNRMFDDLLLMARLEENDVEVTEPLILRRLLTTVVGQFQRLHPARIVELEATGPVVVIRATERYVEAVLRNVLSNAHRFSPIEKPIRLTVQPFADRVVVTVRDFGSGIRPDELRRVFEPYYRSSPVTDGTRGIGIGLALCLRVMKAMDGDIEVRNRSGEGLEVDLIFPVESAGDDIE